MKEGKGWREPQRSEPNPLAQNQGFVIPPAPAPAGRQSFLTVQFGLSGHGAYVRGAVVVWGENEACQTLPERTTTTACIIIKMFVLVLTTCQARGSTSIPRGRQTQFPVVT